MTNPNDNVSNDSETLATLLDFSSENKNANKTALVLPKPLNATLSYLQLKEVVNSFRTILVRELGVGTGNVVAMAFPNSFEFVVAFLGIGVARSVSFNKHVLNASLHQLLTRLFFLGSVSLSVRLSRPASSLIVPASKPSYPYLLPIPTPRFAYMQGHCSSSEPSLHNFRIRILSPRYKSHSLPPS